MKVQKAYENLKKLVEEGYGDVELLAISDQGDTAEGSVGAAVCEVGEQHSFQGEMLDMDPGTKYVPIFFG